MDTAISVSEVSKRYGKVVALRAVDLDVATGTIVGLVGPNGAGKTTLIRILVGALQADSGTVRILGRDPFVERREVRAGLGYMPQACVLYQDLTVRENITFFARGHMWDGVSQKLAAVLDFVDLSDVADRPVQALSGGKQRVSLAATLGHEPSVLFLDEPTAGIDPELRHAFWLRFRELAESGVTLMVSTHQMDEVVHCDRVAIIRSGGVLAHATPAALFAAGGATIRVSTPAGIEVHRVASLPDDLPRLLRGMGLDPSVARIEVEGATLEDILLRLIETGEAGAG